MIEPKAEEPRDGLGTEPRGRRQLGIARGDPDPSGGGRQPERADELGIELAHRDELRRVGRRRGRLSPRDESVGQLAARQRIGRPEGGGIVAEDARCGDDPNLGIGPRLRRRRRPGQGSSASRAEPLQQHR